MLHRPYEILSKLQANKIIKLVHSMCHPSFMLHSYQKLVFRVCISDIVEHILTCGHALGRLLVEQLATVDPSELKHDEKLAFWINLYNTLLMHVRSSLKKFILLVFMD